MKKKVLSALLAVALFVGLAVPAFAASSSVEGDPNAVTKIEFAKSSYDVKEGKTLNLMDEVTAYVGTKSSVLAENAGLTFSIVGNSAVVTVDETTGVVEALEKSGTATVMATSQDGKITGKTTIKCVPASALIKATGFAFDTTKEIPVGSATAAIVGEAAVITLDLTGSSTNATGASTFELTIGGATVTSESVAASKTATDVATAFDGKTVTVDGVVYNIVNSGAKIVLTQATPFKKLSTAPVASLVITTDLNGTATITSTVLTKAGVTTAASGFNSPEDLYIKVVSTPKDATFSADQKLAIVDKMAEWLTENVTIAGATATVVNDDDHGIAFKIESSATNGIATGVKKKITLNFNKDFPVYSEDSPATKFTTIKREVEMKTVAAKDASAISIPGTLVIEVGEKATLKPVFSSHNQGVSVTWDTDIYGTDSTYDYAVVSKDPDSNNGIVTGVAVGTNKIVATLNGSKTATCTVKVVEKGTKSNVVAAPSVTTATLEVGGTQYVTVKNAKDDAKYTFEIDNANATIVPGTNAVKIFAKKIGTAKVTCYEDGAEIGTITVTVKAASTTTPSKPGASDNPQTGDSIFAGLF